MYNLFVAGVPELSKMLVAVGFLASTMAWAADNAYQQLDAAASKLASLGRNALMEGGSAPVTAPVATADPGPRTSAVAAPARTAVTVEELLKKQFWIGPVDSGYWMFKFGQSNSVWVYSRNEDDELYRGQYDILNGSDISASLGSVTNRYTLSVDGTDLALARGGIGPASLTNRGPIAENLGRQGQTFIRLRK